MLRVTCYHIDTGFDLDVNMPSRKGFQDIDLEFVMSYHKQLQKQKRKQMALEREKQNRPKNNAYSQTGPGAAWKAFLSLALIVGVIVYTMDLYPGI